MKIKVLDGLRGYAALLVVVAHLPQITDSVFAEKLYTIVGISKFGYLGVDIFFVLSGFLITRILIKEKKENNFSFKRFYAKRALRIFPIYYLVIILSGLIFSWNKMGYVATYLSNYFFSFYSEAHSLRHTWSLAVEEHFYLIWPALLYFFSLKNAKNLILYVTPIIVILSFFITYYLYDNQIADGIVYRATHFRILSLAIGSFFAFIEPSIRNLKKFSTHLIAVILILIYLITVFSYKIIPSGLLTPLHFIMFSIISSLFFLFVLQKEKTRGIINFLFTNKVIRYIGAISYGIYLYHYPIMYYYGYTYQQLGSNSIEFNEIIIPLILLFLIPSISYFIIEKPLLKLKDKLN